MKDDFDASATNDESRLRPLSEVPDYEIADGYPDVRGWVVLGADGRRLGSVHELIVDTEALCTRYLDVALEWNASGSADTREVLVPIGSASLDELGESIILDGDLVSRLASLPAYVGGHITREFENRLLPVSAADAPANKDFYASRHFDDSRFVRARRAERPDADEQRVTRVEEELAFQKQQLEAGEAEIDRAVEKRPVVKEEVVVTKQVVADGATAEADFRKEQVDINRRTSPQTKDTHRDSDAR